MSQVLKSKHPRCTILNGKPVDVVQNQGVRIDTKDLVAMDLGLA